VDAYEQYVLDNAELVQFVNQARTGGTPALRQAITNELDAFGIRIGSALPAVVPGLAAADRDPVARLILAVLVESSTTLLDVSAKSDALRAEAKAELERKLTVILLGAESLAARGARTSASAKATSGAQRRPTKAAGTPKPRPRASPRDTA